MHNAYICGGKILKILPKLQIKTNEKLLILVLKYGIITPLDMR